MKSHDDFSADSATSENVAHLPPLSDCLFLGVAFRVRTEDPNKVGIIMLLVEQSGGNVVIQIRDNGPGIPSELHEKIWDPYFTTKTPPHTGAGLHLARAIVQAAGGGIVLKSPGPACSTQFSILLPMNVVEEDLPLEKAPVEEPLAEKIPAEEVVHSLSEDADAAMAAEQAPEEKPASQA